MPTSGPATQFLKSEFLTLSVRGALEHSNTYKLASDRVRAQLRRMLRKKLNEVANRYKHPVANRYKYPVSDAEHEANIREVADAVTSKFADYLVGRRFRIGIAQKALNLYLKYLWCAKKIPMPPHCPFDRLIVSKLPKGEQLNWTQIQTIKRYKRLVRAARKKADGLSLAEWELESWEPR